MEEEEEGGNRLRLFGVPDPSYITIIYSGTQLSVFTELRVKYHLDKISLKTNKESGKSTLRRQVWGRLGGSVF